MSRQGTPYESSNDDQYRPRVDNPSFGIAVIMGRINGPDWPVVDSETGEVAQEGSQDFGHSFPGRTVKSQHSDTVLGYVIDLQFPADGPQPELDD